MAPYNAPGIDANPPIAMSTSSVIDTNMPKLSGATIPDVSQRSWRRSGVRVVHGEFPRIWHDFQLYAGVVPDATQSVEELTQFIERELAKAK